VEGRGGLHARSCGRQNTRVNRPVRITVPRVWASLDWLWVSAVSRLQLHTPVAPQSASDGAFMFTFVGYFVLVPAE